MRSIGIVIIIAGLSGIGCKREASSGAGSSASSTGTNSAAPSGNAGCAKLQTCCTALGNDFGGGTQRDCRQRLDAHDDGACDRYLGELRTASQGMGAPLPAACN